LGSWLERATVVVGLGVSAYHEVALEKRDLLSQSGPLRIPLGPRNLVRIVIHPDHLAAGEASDLPGRPANTAPDIEHLHVLFDAKFMGQEVLVSCQGLQERLGDGKAAEMERLAPGFLVEVRGEVVVADRHP
jgi:hypothetical protein